MGAIAGGAMMVGDRWSRRGGLAVVAAVALAAGPGCVAHIRQTSGPEGAFIYGLFDVSGTKDGAVSCVGVTQDERVGLAMRHGCMSTMADGLFFLEDAPPVRHYLHGFLMDQTYNSLRGFQEPFPVKEGELHLYGVYRYEKISDPFIGNGSFALQPTNRPSHAEVLRKLLAQENVSDRWKQRIRDRLKELGER
jgi:hypothetical protein